jgi:hypothetical protein
VTKRRMNSRDLPLQKPATVTPILLSVPLSARLGVLPLQPANIGQSLGGGVRGNAAILQISREAEGIVPAGSVRGRKPLPLPVGARVPAQQRGTRRRRIQQTHPEEVIRAERHPQDSAALQRADERTIKRGQDHLQDAEVGRLQLHVAAPAPPGRLRTLPAHQ